MARKRVGLTENEEGIRSLEAMSDKDLRNECSMIFDPYWCGTQPRKKIIDKMAWYVGFKPKRDFRNPRRKQSRNPSPKSSAILGIAFIGVLAWVLSKS